MGGARITGEQHAEIVRRFSAGESVTNIARSMGISQYAVRCHASDAPKPTLATVPCEEGERWTEVHGFEGRYLVSSHGRVFATGASGGPRKLLRIYGTKNGYDYVMLAEDGPKKLYVHRLVAEHFCDGRTDANSEVRHIDGNLKNNSADNLEWCGQGDRSMHVKCRHDRVRTISAEQANRARAMYHFGAAMADISKILDIPYNKARDLVVGEERFDDVILYSEPGEEWKPVDGFDGKYYVSSFGRVFSTGGRTRRGGMLHVYTTKNGYQSVTLSGDGRRGSTPLHRLVALHFCDGHDDTNDVVNHIDGNPSNNRADNLEWCTQSYNIRHAIDVLGRNIGGHPCSDETRAAIRRAMTGRPGTVRKFTEDEIRAIRADHRSSTQLAKAIGVNKSTIQKIRNRETYAYVD